MRYITNTFAVFIPQKGYVITPVFMTINILLFIVMVAAGVHILSPSSESLIAWGADYKPLTLNGEWWRIITCCFIHIGIIHLAVNMYALLNIGRMLEPFIGSVRFLAAYLLTGIASSMVSLWWHDISVSAGASGAIFGMFGLLLALLTTNLIDRSIRFDILKNIGTVIALNLVIGMSQGIDNAAHIGGLISGLLIGYLYFFSLKKDYNTLLKYTTIAIAAIVTLAGTVYGMNNINRDTIVFETKMKQFGILEEQALEAYHWPDHFSNEQIAAQLKEKGIKNWNACMTLLTSLDDLDVPLAYRTRIRQLKQYTSLRTEVCRLAYDNVKNNSTANADKIEALNLETEKILKEINGTF